MDILLEPTIAELVKMGVVFSMFVIITFILCGAIKVLYNRNQMMADAFLKAITEHTTATNNLANKIENFGAKDAGKA